MDRPNPFTLIVQTLSALLGGVWARLFLGRAEAAAMKQMMAAFQALDALFADWRAGKFAQLPEAEPMQVGAVPAEEAVARAEDGAVRRPRTRRAPAAAARRRVRMQARPRRIVRRPVNWSLIPDWIGPRAQRRALAAPRLAEWSG